MEIMPFFKRLGTKKRHLFWTDPTPMLTLHLLMKSVIRLNLPNPKHVILSTRGHESTILAELYNPNGGVVILKFDCLLDCQVVEVLVCFFVSLCSHTIVHNLSWVGCQICSIHVWSLPTWIVLTHLTGVLLMVFSVSFHLAALDDALRNLPFFFHTAARGAII